LLLGAPHSFPTRRSSDLSCFVPGRLSSNFFAKRTLPMTFRYSQARFAEFVPQFLRFLHDTSYTPSTWPRGSPMPQSAAADVPSRDRKSTRLNSSHRTISY